jgi:WD40 repeat protein
LHRSWTIVGDGDTSLGPVAFLPDGRLLAGGSMVGERAGKRTHGEICQWEVGSNLLVWRQSCHDDDVTGLAFTVDGEMLVSGGRDMAVKLWEITERLSRPSR